MRRPINTVNGTYKSPNLAYSAQDALNVIPMMTEKGGTRTVSQYVDAPGLKPFCRIGTNDGESVTAAGAGRGLRVVDGNLYAVAGRNLWQITSAGVSVNYGTIPGVGRVSMAHNQRGLGNELAIDNGQSRYVFNTQTQDLAKVTDESFPGSIKAVFIDGYIPFLEPQGRYWGHSDLSNALNYNIFDQYEAEGQPDRIVSLHVSNRELLVLGQDTIEPYVNSPSGSGEAPFVKATNTVIENGCSARDAVCTVGPYTVYLDQNRTVQVLNGYTPVPISTSVIDSALQACTKQQIANAYAFAVESEGFQIYYLTVPGKFTFGYDFKNREWHRRSSTGLDWWAVTDVVQWNGSWYALDSRRGDILELRWRDYPFDVQEELVREWVTGTISADQNPIFVNELELLFGCGGQAYTTVDFPEQPVGPSIAGNPPGGTVGTVYGPYAFTVTPGDAPIARTIILTGTLPPGLSWNQNAATISTGTPAETGLFSFTLRTIDTNGLYADLDVSILVSLPMLALSTIGGIGTASSGDGSWSSPWTHGTGIYAVIGILGNSTGFTCYGSDNTRRPIKTEDYGGSWTEGTGDNQLSVGGFRIGGINVSTGVTLLPQGLNSGFLRQSTASAAWERIGTKTTNAVVPIGDRWLSVSIYDAQLSYSDDDGDTWTDGWLVSGVSFASSLKVSSFNGIARIGASNATNTAPVILKTEDGITGVSETLPATTGTKIVAISVDAELSIAMTEEGEILYNDGSGWELSPENFGCVPTGIAFDGVGFTAIGGDQTSGDANALIRRSEDGINWTTVKTSPLGVGEVTYGIAALGID